MLIQLNWCAHKSIYVIKYLIFPVGLIYFCFKVEGHIESYFVYYRRFGAILHKQRVFGNNSVLCCLGRVPFQ